MSCSSKALGGGSQDADPQPATRNADRSSRARELLAREDDLFLDSDDSNPQRTRNDASMRPPAALDRPCVLLASLRRCAPASRPPSQAPTVIKLRTLVPDGSVWHKVDAATMGAEWSQATAGPRPARASIRAAWPATSPTSCARCGSGQIQARARSPPRGLCQIDPRVSGVRRADVLRLLPRAATRCSTR